jgi:hypothetical protein
MTGGCIEYLAMRGYLLPIAPKVIREKSTTDILAKVLSCVQVTWFAVQIIGRAAYGLPVSLLEIHLSINIAFILAAYILWFQVSEAPHLCKFRLTGVRNRETSEKQL